MKKVISIITVFLFVILFNACGTKPAQLNEKQNPSTASNSTQSTTASTTYTIKDYYPFKENTKYTYDGSGSEYAAHTTQIDYIKDNKIQVRTTNSGTESVGVIENNNSELKLVFSKGEECYYREDFTSSPSNKDQILLKEPLVKGTSWTQKDGSKSYISNVDVEVKTPSGTYKALEVTNETDKAKEYTYYALNTGIVKTTYKAASGGLEVTSSLSKVENNSPLIQNIKFYFPNFNDNNLGFTQKQISFYTNDITKAAFEKRFKEEGLKDAGKILSPNAKIKSLYLNSDKMVYVDFSKEFVSEMNAGAGYESMILQSITNTLGAYYNTDKVYITVEDKPYASGHILMKKGEPFTVNFSNSVEIK